MASKTSIRTSRSMGQTKNPVKKGSTTSVKEPTKDPVAPPAPTAPVAPASNKKYQYVDTNKQVRTIEAPDAETAIASAKDRAPTSGVIDYREPSADAVTSSSGDSRKEEQDLGTKIKTVSAPSYNSPSNFANSSYIREMEQSLRQTLSLQENQIDSDFDEVKRGTEASQKGEVGTTSAMLARVGGYLGNSGSGNAVVLNLAASHRAELLSIESKRQAALSEARIAYQDKKYDIAKLKLDEAKSYESEVYKRQQDFFDNTIKALGEERTANNQVRDDARAVLTNIISNSNGQSFDELDEESRALLEQNAQDAGYPLSVVKNLLAAPKAEQGKIDTLIRAAVGKGAPPELLDAASSAGSYVEAAKILAPYLAAKTGSGGNNLDVKYVPAALQGPVSQYGASTVYDQLLSDKPPAWFYPVVQQFATTNYESLGLAEPTSDPDPNGWISKSVWDKFKKESSISTFKTQVDKKIGIPVSSGGFFGNLPEPDTVNVDE